VLNQAPAGSSFLRNASWALSNLCRGKPAPDYNLVKGAIPTFIKVLVENDQEDIITDVCWALSYLSDGVKERVEVLLEPIFL
jgi:importin subunit alpha-6/7